MQLYPMSTNAHSPCRNAKTFFRKLKFSTLITLRNFWIGRHCCCEDTDEYFKCMPETSTYLINGENFLLKIWSSRIFDYISKGTRLGPVEDISPPSSESKAFTEIVFECFPIVCLSFCQVLYTCGKVSPTKVCCVIRYQLSLHIIGSMATWM